jgi:hypothetical protein
LFDTLQRSLRIFGAFGELGVVPMAQTARDDGSMSASGDVTGRGSHMSATFRVDRLFRRKFRAGHHSVDQREAEGLRTVLLSFYIFRFIG